MKKSKPAVATLPAPPVRSSALPHVTGIRHAGPEPGVSANARRVSAHALRAFAHALRDRDELI